MRPPGQRGLNTDIWAGRRVLVTGHTGFKGAWLAALLEDHGAEVHGIALPAESDSGIYSVVAANSSIRSHICDIRDRDTFRELVQKIDPVITFHLAAQALVRRGYLNPVGTFDVNVVGTAHLLEALTGSTSSVGVVVATSDKVYENRGQGTPFVETDRLGGSDPYSSSKACAELLIAAWRRSFLQGNNLQLTTVRAGNVIGGGDEGEDRLVPDIFRALSKDGVIHLRYPDATRPWQFVLDPLHAYVLVAEAMLRSTHIVPSALNIGPALGEEVRVRDLVEAVVRRWGSGRWVQSENQELAEHPLLAIDARLARESLGWHPMLSVREAIEWTVEWHRAQLEGADMVGLTRKQIRTFLRMTVPYDG